MAEKRHLKVISADTPSEEEGAAVSRTAPGWILLGTAMLVALWLPLCMLGLWLARLTPASGAVAVVLLLGSFSAAACATGATIGRFARQPGIWLAASAGGLGGALVASLSAVAGALRPLLLALTTYGLLCLVGAISAACGSRWGRRRRSAASLDEQPQAEGRAESPRDRGP